MVRKSTSWLGFVAGVACFFMMGATAHAVKMIDFGVIAPTTGTISYDGTATGALVGSGISVDNVVALNPTFPTPPAACVGCVLNFSTGGGPLVSTVAGSSWTFVGGPTSSNFITITGTVKDSSLVTQATGVLLTGTFGTATVIQFGSTFKIAGAAFFDTKNTDLLKFLGLPNSNYNGNFNISFTAGGSSPAKFTSRTVLSGDIVNVPVPEPATIMLLGSGLAGFAYLARRRRKLS